VTEQDNLRKEVDETLENPDIPQFYAQTFIASLGAGDFFLVLKRNNTPVAVVNLPITTMKSLAMSLMGQLQFLEAKGVQVLSSEELSQKFTGTASAQTDRKDN
jgi:hypothetical protein